MGIIMKQTKTLPKNIEEKLDAQLADLKKMILDNYRDATAYKMEVDVFTKVQDIGKTSMEGYMLKKTQN
jgi:hypothetical protein